MKTSVATAILAARMMGTEIDSNYQTFLSLVRGPLGQFVPKRVDEKRFAACMRRYVNDSKEA